MSGMIESPLVQLSIKPNGDTEAKPGRPRFRNVFFPVWDKMVIASSHWPLLQLTTPGWHSITQTIYPTAIPMATVLQHGPLPLLPFSTLLSPSPFFHLKLTKAVISTPLHGLFQEQWADSRLLSQPKKKQKTEVCLFFCFEKMAPYFDTCSQYTPTAPLTKKSCFRGRMVGRLTRGGQVQV